ncbi:MAG: hypothetical protein ACE5NM_11005 [Sedimentisphaerales bacterium]
MMHFGSKKRVSKVLSLPDSRKKDLLDNAFFLKDLVDKDLFNDIPEMAGELRRVAKLLKQDQKPTEREHIPSKMLGDTITIKGLQINWRVICDKLKKQVFRLRTFLHKK